MADPTGQTDPPAVPKLRGEALGPWLKRLPGWDVVNEHHLSRSYSFPDFATALAFVVEIGKIAEAARHHPEIQLTYGKVVVRTWSHDANGLTERDIELAEAIDQLPRG